MSTISFQYVYGTANSFTIEIFDIKGYKKISERVSKCSTLP